MNAMLDRIADLRRTAADLAHDLRTPLGHVAVACWCSQELHEFMYDPAS